MQSGRLKPFKSGMDGYLFICDPENEAASRAEIEDVLRCIVGSYADMMLETKRITKKQFKDYERIALDKSGPISQSHGFSPCACKVEGYLPYVCNHSFHHVFYANTFGMLLHYYDNLPAEARKAKHVQKIVPFVSCCRSNTKTFMARAHFTQVICAMEFEFPYSDKAGDENYCAVNVHVRNNPEMDARREEIEKLFASKLVDDDDEDDEIMEYEPAILDPKQRAKFKEHTTVYVNVYILGPYTFMGYAESAEKYEKLYVW